MKGGKCSKNEKAKNKNLPKLTLLKVKLKILS